MINKVITNIISLVPCKQGTVYRVELGIQGEKKKICWVLPLQAEKLACEFENTKKGYSSREKEIIGVFSDDGYYKYYKTNHTPEKEREFRPPTLSVNLVAERRLLCED